MHKITGDSQYLQKFNTFKTTINNGSKTPGGMWFIQQWGSVRHAANAAFLFASSGDKAAAKEQIDFILGKRFKFLANLVKLYYRTWFEGYTNDRWNTRFVFDWLRIKLPK